MVDCAAFNVEIFITMFLFSIGMIVAAAIYHKRKSVSVKEDLQQILDDYERYALEGDNTETFFRQLENIRKKY